MEIELYLYNVLVRWGHILVGIAWIGLLYYFNFVQTEYVKVADPDAKADVMKKLAPNALWWFRWAAFLTFLVFTSHIAEAKLYRIGDKVENEIKFSKKFKLPLADGDWYIVDRYGYSYYFLQFKGVAVARIENKEIMEAIYVERANLSGKEMAYVDNSVISFIFKDKYDGCYQRPEYYIVEVYKRGSTHNCLVARHYETEKELYTPDDPLRGSAQIKKWINEKKDVTNKETNIQPSKYQSYEKKELVKDKKLIKENINENNFQIIDARSKDRFDGKVPEPREGLRSGNIKNSFCIPFNQCLNKDKTFKNPEELRNVFKTCLKNINEQNIVFSCGSGVTACVLALAYSLINDKYHPCIYDGSWAEYGII